MLHNLPKLMHFFITLGVITWRALGTRQIYLFKCMLRHPDLLDCIDVCSVAIKAVVYAE